MLELTAIFLAAVVAPFFGEAHPFLFNFGDAATGGTEALAGLLASLGPDTLGATEAKAEALEKTGFSVGAGPTRLSPESRANTNE